MGLSSLLAHSRVELNQVIHKNLYYMTFHGTTLIGTRKIAALQAAFSKLLRRAAAFSCKQLGSLGPLFSEIFFRFFGNYFWQQIFREIFLQEICLGEKKFGKFFFRKFLSKLCWKLLLETFFSENFFSEFFFWGNFFQNFFLKLFVGKFFELFFQKLFLGIFFSGTFFLQKLLQTYIHTYIHHRHHLNHIAQLAGLLKWGEKRDGAGSGGGAAAAGVLSTFYVLITELMSAWASKSHP